MLDNRGAARSVARADPLADGTYGIQLRNVIGHNESLTSPYHRERYRAWRCQTHGDWRRADMEIYRAALARLARRWRPARARGQARQPWLSRAVGARALAGSRGEERARTGANGGERPLALAMQKVVGSSPIIRTGDPSRRRGSALRP